jgi:radical SAM-linked protein
MIAWPLPVGVCGEAEWGEMELEGQMLPSETMGLLNPYLPLGLSVSEMEQIPRSSPSLESSLSRALYRICLDPVTASEWTPRSSFLFSPGSPAAFLGADSITARTKRKGREVLVDLKPLIHEFFLTEDPPSPCWQLTLRLDQRGCISPLKVMSRLFSNYLDEEEANQLVLRLKINRKALF